MFHLKTIPNLIVPILVQFTLSGRKTFRGTMSVITSLSWLAANSAHLLTTALQFSSFLIPSCYHSRKQQRACSHSYHKVAWHISGGVNVEIKLFSI